MVSVGVLGDENVGGRERRTRTTQQSGGVVSSSFAFVRHPTLHRDPLLCFNASRERRTYGARGANPVRFILDTFGGYSVLSPPEVRRYERRALGS